MSKDVINPEPLAAPHGFNHGILMEAGQLLFLAGQDASGPDGEIVAPGDLVGQFEQVMSNLTAVTEAAGGTPEDLVKLNIYVADRDEYVAKLEPLGEVFSRYVEVYPAMALFEVNRFFQEEAMIELEGFAVVQPD
jgi:enamine deaminase RidA (YjgF/YER057c/UK114 family)